MEEGDGSGPELVGLYFLVSIKSQQVKTKTESYGSSYTSLSQKTEVDVTPLHVSIFTTTPVRRWSDSQCCKSVI